jgi:type II secretory pathway component GspD/PulD (secretin)
MCRPPSRFPRKTRCHLPGLCLFFALLLFFPACSYTAPKADLLKTRLKQLFAPSDPLAGEVVAATAGGDNGEGSPENSGDSDAARRRSPGSAGLPKEGESAPTERETGVRLKALPPEKIEAADGMILEQEGDRKGMLTKFYRIRNIQGKKLKQILENWRSEKGRILDYPDLNMLIITETPHNMVKIEEVLEQIDLLSPQVEIETKVIEIRRDLNFEYGFDFFVDRAPATRSALRRMEGHFNTQSFLESLLPGGAINPNPNAFQGAAWTFAGVGKVVKKFGDFELVLRALEEVGYAEIISSPRIIVHNGQRAQLNTIKEVPIQITNIANNVTTITTKFKQVGTKLSVRPIVIGKRAIQLEIRPEVSSVTGFAAPGAGVSGIAIPEISSRNANTIVNLRDGETLVIGGLIDKRILKTENRVPVLGTLPLIGTFFRSRNKEEVKTEIIFILKVSIISETSKAKTRLRIPEVR